MRRSLGLAVCLALVGSLLVPAQAQSVFVHYSFDGVPETLATGDVFLDESGNGNDATLFVDTDNSDPTAIINSSTDANVCQSWEQKNEGAETHALLTTPFTPDTTTVWTIAFWHEMSGGVSTPLFDNTSNDHLFEVFASGTNRVQVKIDGQAGRFWTIPSGLGQNTFNHFALVVDPGGIAGVDVDGFSGNDRLALYVDGVLQTPNSGQNLTTYRTNVVCNNIGDGASTDSAFLNGHFDGLDEFFIFEDWALTASEVARLIASNDPGFEADRGDAPTAAQSGFASSYPVLKAGAACGASHLIAGPRLGAERDGEADGQTSANADGDDSDGTDDDDGVTFLSGLYVSTSTTLRFALAVDLQNAASSNFLDAWIDLNRDGDWEDPGEQVLTNEDLGTTTGTVVVPITLPQDTGSNIELGTTYMRFRLSTSGGLSPRGAADNGEVEDYEVALLDPSGSAASVVLPETGGGISLERSGDNLLVRLGGMTLFEGPVADFASLTITGSAAGDDVLTVDLTGPSPLPAGGLSFDGGSGGSDSLVLSGGTAGGLTVTQSGAGAGSMDLDGTPITFTGLE